MVHKVWCGAIGFGMAVTAALPAFADNVPYRTPIRRAVLEDARMLDESFQRASFDLAVTRKSGVVPRFFVDRLPRDLGNLQGKARHEAFIRILLPLVAKANEVIAQQRARYLAIVRTEAAGGFLTRNERAWLREFAQLYGINALQTEKGARRIDVVPPSLVVAHAIQASDWGADAPAIADNALFGDFTGPSGAEFPSLLNAVMAHMYRVNTHYRFAEFRRQRARARAAGRQLSGLALAEAYRAGAPELGAALATLIRRYDLAALDGAALPRDAGATLVALTRNEPVREADEKDKDDALLPSLYFDPDRQDPSDRFAAPLPGGKYGDSLR